MFGSCLFYNHASSGGAGWGPDSKFSPRGPEFVVTPLTCGHAHLNINSANGGDDVMVKTCGG